VNSNHAVLTNAMDQAKKLFFLEMGQESTAYVYGSGAIGAWASARSDLDLLIFIKQSDFPHFQAQLRKWKSSKLSSLDGFVCFKDTSCLLALRLDDLFDGRRDVVRSLLDRILPPDLWMLQYRSKKMFGENGSLDNLPKVSQQDLQRWARSNRDAYWIPALLEGISILSSKDPDFIVPITPTIWVASGASRIANLIRGGECISKQDALERFIDYQPKSEVHIKSLIENYELTDDVSGGLKVEQALEISNFCLELLRRSKDW